MKKRILIVDDSDAIRFSLKDILSTDYKVETAADGEIALEKLKVFSPDLVLLDVDMPVLDGLETCRRIRMDEKFKFVKILMLSGKINIADRLTGYEIGADDYLRKPFDKGELLSKIRVFLRLKYLEEVDRLKKSLLDLMGHEINTPLNGIIAPAYTLMHDESLKMEDVKELAVSIYDSARWFHNNFKKSMLLVKLKSGRKLTITNESVREYLDVAMSKLHPRIEEKQLALKSKIDPNLEWRGDWVLLSQTLRYIIDNAIKFSHAKGEINIIATHENSDLVISISDQGPGINPARLTEIFDEFAVKNVMSHSKGIAVSMAIAKLVLEHHNGSITVKSEPGKGATFVLKIPEINS